MWIISKKYVVLEFYHTFPNSLVILDKYFSPCRNLNGILYGKSLVSGRMAIQKTCYWLYVN